MDLNLPTITFFAKRVIKSGEELTFDYNMKNAEAYAEKKKQELLGVKKAGGDNKDIDSDDESTSSGISSYNEESVSKFTARCPCKCGTSNCRAFYM